MNQGYDENPMRKFQSTYVHFQIAFLAAGFDFLQVLFQHYEHRAFPLQLVELYGSAAWSEQEEEEQGK